jgi:hypothetical protein
VAVTVTPVGTPGPRKAEGSGAGRNTRAEEDRRRQPQAEHPSQGGSKAATPGRTPGPGNVEGSSAGRDNRTGEGRRRQPQAQHPSQGRPKAAAPSRTPGPEKTEGSSAGRQGLLGLRGRQVAAVPRMVTVASGPRPAADRSGGRQGRRPDRPAGPRPHRSPGGRRPNSTAAARSRGGHGADIGRTPPSCTAVEQGESVHRTERTKRRERPRGESVQADGGRTGTAPQ